MAGGAYISSLDDGTSNYAGYVIYSAAEQPIRVVLINTDYYDGTGERTYQSFVLRGLVNATVVATRLTAASALSRQDFGDMPTFGGQVFSNQTCNAEGELVTEAVCVVDGSATFSVAASEALIIDL